MIAAIKSAFGALTDIVVPPWARWAAIAALALAAYGTGRLQEARHDGSVHEASAEKQAAKVITVIKHEVQTVTKVETVYRDRIQKIYVQEKQLEADIPKIITPDIDHRLPLPAGFVRVLDAAWAGTAAGPASDADGEPASVPPSVVAANESANAASCRAWREQTLGWRAFYAGQQVNINGKAGDWYRAADAAP